MNQHRLYSFSHKYDYEGKKSAPIKKKCNLTLAMSPTCHSKSPQAYNSTRHILILVLPYFLRLLEFIFGPVQSRQTDRQTDDRQQTESDTYEPTVQHAQVGSKRIPFLAKVPQAYCSNTLFSLSVYRNILRY